MCFSNILHVLRHCSVSLSHHHNMSAVQLTSSCTQHCQNYVCTVRHALSGSPNSKLVQAAVQCLPTLRTHAMKPDWGTAYSSKHYTVQPIEMSSLTTLPVLQQVNNPGRAATTVNVASNARATCRCMRKAYLTKQMLAHTAGMLRVKLVPHCAVCVQSDGDHLCTCGEQILPAGQ